MNCSHGKPISSCAPGHPKKRKRVAWNRKCVCGHPFIHHDGRGCKARACGWGSLCLRFRPAKVKRGR